MHVGSLSLLVKLPDFDCADSLLIRAIRRHSPRRYTPLNSFFVRFIRAIHLLLWSSSILICCLKQAFGSRRSLLCQNISFCFSFKLGLDYSACIRASNLALREAIHDKIWATDHHLCTNFFHIATIYIKCLSILLYNWDRIENIRLEWLTPILRFLKQISQVFIWFVHDIIENCSSSAWVGLGMSMIPVYFVCMMTSLIWVNYTRTIAPDPKVFKLVRWELIDGCGFEGFKLSSLWYLQLMFHHVFLFDNWASGISIVLHFFFRLIADHVWRFYDSLQVLS